MKVGFIGVGNIGRPMAENFTAPDFDLAIYDAFPAAAAALEGKAKIAATPAAIAKHASLIGICVRDEKDVMTVLNGPDGLLANAAPGAIIAVHSTIRPATIKSLAADAANANIHIIDAPVSRGPTGLGAQKFVCMVGAPQPVYDRIRPYFEAFASDLIHAGPEIGAGMTLKLCNNLATYIELSAGIEAFRLAEAAGLSTDLVREVMMSAGTLTNSMSQFNQFVAAARGDRETNAPRKLWTISLAEKDLDCALSLAADLGVDLPVTKSARANFRGTIEYE